MGISISDESRFRQNELEDLEKLLVIARGQNNCINLNLVYITFTLNEQNYDKVMNYFSERGIVMIQDDIEPDVPAPVSPIFFQSLVWIKTACIHIAEAILLPKPLYRRQILSKKPRIPCCFIYNPSFAFPSSKPSQTLCFPL